MIPKTIHYCWFGRGKKPPLVKKCIASWRKFMPEYEIIEWNEDTFDINANAYTKMCYEQKKYAFLTDYVRLLVVAEHGGIYFDTDVEALRSFDELLENESFFGFETEEYVATGLGFGAQAGNPIVLQMIREYDAFLDGRHGTEGCPRLNTKALLKFHLQQNGQKQNLDGAVIYPTEYFNPLNSATGQLSKTKNTYSIHWYSMSWLSPSKRQLSRLARPFHRLFGVHCFDFLKGK